MNTKHPLYKEKLRIERDLNKLYQIKYNQNWIELETPYKSGYYKTFDLRDDIKNRDDAWVFYECIRLVVKRAWNKNKSFKSKIKKGKFEYISPSIGVVSKEVYDRLVPAVKKYFFEISWPDKYWNPYRKNYTCRLPSYYLVEKIEPRWITHYKEVDSVIECQISEKDDYLSSKKFWSIKGWHSHVPKEFCKPYNRSDRRNGKQTVKRNIGYGDDYAEYEYRYAHKHSAKWDYW